jgi:hypothetical protein
MKKAYLYLTLIAFASFSFVSCDEDENTLTEEGGIIGTWEGDPDQHHYPIAVINADGTYEWEWSGVAKFKDVGTYTYADNKIVMTGKNFYEWDSEKGKYVDNDWVEGNTKRNIKIIDLTPGVMNVELNDYFMGGGQGEGFPFILYRKGLVQDIKTKDLEGTWESYDSDGSLGERIIISGNNFTAYEVWTTDTILCAEKSTGTWSVKSNVLTVKPKDLYYSYSRPTGTGNYVYSVVDPVTLEAENWTKATYTPDEYEERIYLSDDKKTLYVAGAKFTKK